MISTPLAYQVNLKSYNVALIEPASKIQLDFTIAVNLIKRQPGDPNHMPLPHI
jgi:hypothetical protein